MIVYVCERVQITHVLCQVRVECHRQFFLSIQHISVDVIFRSSRIFSVQSFCSVRQHRPYQCLNHLPVSLPVHGMEQAFHRVVNSHILRFAIAMHVHTFASLEQSRPGDLRESIHLKFRNLLCTDGGILFIGHSEHIGSRQNCTIQCVMTLIGEFEPCFTKHVD